MAKSDQGRAIRFVVDYRGKLTKEQYFTAGSVVNAADCDPPIDADGLVAEGRAVPYDGVVEVSTPEGAEDEGGE